MSRDVKMCGACRRVLSMDDFYRRSDAYDGRQSRCKQCSYEKRARVYKQLPDGPKQQVHVQLPVDLHREVKALSAVRGESLSRTVALVLKQGLHAKNWAAGEGVYTS